MAMLDEGLSIRAMATRLGLSYSAVRHRLGRYELATPRARRPAETASARAGGDETVFATCPVHGLTLFIRRASGGLRCPPRSKQGSLLLPTVGQADSEGLASGLQYTGRG